MFRVMPRAGLFMPTTTCAEWVIIGVEELGHIRTQLLVPVICAGQAEELCDTCLTLFYMYILGLTLCVTHIGIFHQNV